MAAIRYWVWLSCQTGVSAVARKLLVEHYGDAQRAFFAPEGEYARIPGISDSDAKQLEKRDMRCVDKILAACDEMEAVLRRYAPADDPNNGGAANSDGAFDADVSDGEPQ